MNLNRSKKRFAKDKKFVPAKHHWDLMAPLARDVKLGDADKDKASGAASGPIVRTGQAECFVTLLVTLPKSIWFNPLRPWVPITIRSMVWPSAVSMILLAGKPSSVR